MNIDNFFAFIDYVYAFNGQKRTVDALCNGTIRFGRWAEVMSKKRRNFESSAFICYVENPNFQKQLPIYYNKLKKSIEGYDKSHWFDNEYDIKTNKRKFLEQKYHEVRRKEIINAFNFLHQLINSESIDDSQKEKEGESKCMAFSPKYDDEKLHEIYQLLIDKDIIDEDTDFNDFRFYFSGRGEKPTKRLKWVGTGTDLAIFIHHFYYTEEKKWEKTKFVFDKEYNYPSVIERLGSRKKEDPFEAFADKIRKKI